ncbi:hypothetical protein Q9189_002723 [Teloschistes chrysophthalmus]
MPSKARPKSMLSFTHRKSSSSSQVKVENLAETAEEKASHRFTSKADPTKAINEAQPGGSLVKYLPATYRYDVLTPQISGSSSRATYSGEYPSNTTQGSPGKFDQYAIRDLIDGNNVQNRRNSYYQGQRPQQRHWSDASNGYYNNRLSIARPDSYIDGYGGNLSQSGYGRRINQRVNSDPTLYGSNAQGVYPAHGYHQSYDTVASGSGNESHNTDPWGNSTDPSSENSSIDRVQHAPKPDLAETYGFNGFGGVPQFPGPILEDHAMDESSYRNSSGHGPSQKTLNGFPTQNKTTLPPTPPPHAPPKQDLPKVPIKLGNSPVKDRSSAHSNGEKRRSWLKRRFSRT